MVTSIEIFNVDNIDRRTLFKFSAENIIQAFA